VSFLGLDGKTFCVIGVANRKSIAFHIARGLEQHGAQVVYIVRTPERRESVLKLLGAEAEIHVCDVEYEDQIENVRAAITERHSVLHGLVHSIAFADFTEGMKPFHETSKRSFLQTVDISCYSLWALSNAFKELFDERASVITLSISTTEMAAESYGWMAPAKAALNSSVCFLAKSFSQFSKVRFNAVCPSLLKTSASAGIPGYIDNYLFAEKCTLRHEALETSEVANAALFLLSGASSGINGQQIILDAGMRLNYFDSEIVRPVVESVCGKTG